MVAGRSSGIPAVTKEVKELLEAIRVAGLSGRNPSEAIILGICRRNESRSIKKSKHVLRVIEENPNLFYTKPSVTSQGTKCNIILLRPQGNELLDMFEAHNEVIHPVSLVRRQRQPGTPTLYVLEAYYTDTGGCKHPITMLFQGKLLFLEHGTGAFNPTCATEVVGEVKCMWKQCIGEVLDFQNPQPVATLPHIKYLIRHIVSGFRVCDSTNTKSELEYACLLVMNRLFPGTKEIKIDVGHELVSVLRIPVTGQEQVYICKNCKTTSCHHLVHLPHRSTNPTIGAIKAKL